MTKLDGIKWNPHAHIDKYSSDQVAYATDRLGHAPSTPELKALFTSPEDGEFDADGNLLVTVGLARITSLITAGGGGAFTNTFGWLAVGDSSTAAAVGDTDLVASTNKYYRALDATYPQTSNGVITAVAQFGSGIAEWVWNEWAIGCVNSGTVTSGTTKAGTGTSPIILNRKVASMGTKGAGSTWVFTVTVTLS